MNILKDKDHLASRLTASGPMARLVREVVPGARGAFQALGPIAILAPGAHQWPVEEGPATGPGAVGSGLDLGRRP